MSGKGRPVLRHQRRGGKALRIRPNTASSPSAGDAVPSSYANAATGDDDTAAGDANADRHAGDSAKATYADADSADDFYSAGDGNSAPEEGRNESAWRARSVPDCDAASESATEPDEEQRKVGDAKPGSAVIVGLNSTPDRFNNLSGGAGKRRFSSTEVGCLEKSTQGNNGSDVEEQDAVREQNRDQPVKCD
jgi:hypothetical protein